MKAGLPSILVLLLTAGGLCCRADDTVVAPELILLPAGEQSLQPVPQSSGYESLWDEATTSAPIVQTSLTQIVAEEVDSRPLESVEAAADEQSEPQAEAQQTTTKPFLDLLQETPQPTPTLAAADAETNDMLVRLAVWTVIILCLCVLSMLGLRRWQRRQGILPEGGGQSRVLETLAIGPGRAVSLIQLGDVRAVVGTDGTGIKTIVLAPAAFDEELSQFDDEPPETAPERAA